MGVMGGAGEVDRLVVKLMADASVYNKTIAQVERSTEQWAGRMAGLGTAMSLSVTLPLTMMGRAAVREFSKFDDAMTKSLAIMTGVTSEMKKEMEDVARALGRKGVQSADQLAESYYFLASAGLNAANAMKALPVVQSFATAGAFDMAKATELLSDSQSALGLRMEDPLANMEQMVRVSDVLTEAANASNASQEQFAKALTTKSAAALRLVNKEVEEGAAILSVYADAGVKGEMAGEKLDITLRELQRVALKHEKAWKGIGVGVFDAGGKMRNISDIVAGLEKTLKGASDQQKVMTMNMLGFRAESFGAIAPLIGLSDKLKEYEERYKKVRGTNVTDKVAAEQLKSFASQVTIATNNLKDMGITIGRILAPYLIKLNDGAVYFAKVWGNMSPALQETTVLLGVVAAAAGPVLVFVGGLILAAPVLRKEWDAVAWVFGKAWSAITGAGPAAWSGLVSGSKAAWGFVVAGTNTAIQQVQLYALVGREAGEMVAYNFKKTGITARGAGQAVRAAGQWLWQYRNIGTRVGDAVEYVLRGTGRLAVGTGRLIYAGLERISDGIVHVVANADRWVAAGYNGIIRGAAGMGNGIIAATNAAGRGFAYMGQASMSAGRWVVASFGSMAAAKRTAIAAWVFLRAQFVAAKAALMSFTAGQAIASAATAAWAAVTTTCSAAVGALSTVLALGPAALAGIAAAVVVAVAGLHSFTVACETAYNDSNHFFAGIWSDAAVAWEGISAAVSNGDFQGAFEIVIAAVKVMWLRFLNEIEQMWIGFSNSVKLKAAKLNPINYLPGAGSFEELEADMTFEELEADMKREARSASFSRKMDINAAEANLKKVSAAVALRNQPGAAGPADAGPLGIDPKTGVLDNYEVVRMMQEAAMGGNPELAALLERGKKKKGGGGVTATASGGTLLGGVTGVFDSLAGSFKALAKTADGAADGLIDAGKAAVDVAKSEEKKLQIGDNAAHGRLSEGAYTALYAAANAGRVTRAAATPSAAAAASAAPDGATDAARLAGYGMAFEGMDAAEPKAALPKFATTGLGQALSSATSWWHSPSGSGTPALTDSFATSLAGSLGINVPAGASLAELGAKTRGDVSVAAAPGGDAKMADAIAATNATSTARQEPGIVPGILKLIETRLREIRDDGRNAEGVDL